MPGCRVACRSVSLHLRRRLVRRACRLRQPTKSLGLVWAGMRGAHAGVRRGFALFRPSVAGKPRGSGTGVSPALEVDIANSTVFVIVFLIVVFRLAYSKFAEPSSASYPDCHSCYLNTSCMLSRAPPTCKHHVLTTFTHCTCVNHHAGVIVCFEN